ncbi:MAG: glycoside hydrolase family 25 protein [Lachnospiraceae bacterium]|nr:glycoside hydrolase family 25 protein [Lachnospiraceae bacterium]
MIKKYVILMGLLITLTGCGISKEKTDGNIPVGAADANSYLSEENSSDMTFSDENTTRDNENAENSRNGVNDNELIPLRYVDAHGEWHDTLINPNVRKHDYDFSLLSNDGQNISLKENEDYELVKGIDVSHHQGNINWDKVKAAGYDFAILRIAFRGYGESGVLKPDTRFKENLTNAHKAGLKVGAYIFSQAINEAEAVEEAEFVLDILGEEELELPVVYDPELIRDDAARTDDVTGEQFTLNTIAFCDRIREAGYETMIYSNMVWEADLFDLEKLSDLEIWYADYEPVPQTPYHFTMWQYSEKGSVPGVLGICDLDVMFVKK